MACDERQVRFEEIRKLWGHVLTVFGDSTGESPEDEEVADEEAEKTLVLRELQKMAMDLIQRMDDGGDLSEFSSGPVGVSLTKVLHEAVPLRPIIEAFGYDWDSTTNSWRLGTIRKQLLHSAKHFIDTKLGEGHTTEANGCNMMAMLSGEGEAVVVPDPGVKLDLDALIDQVRNKRQVPDIDEIKTICHKAREMLEKEDNLLTIEPPCTVVGDIHGQFDDLCCQILDKGGDPATTKYVFLGDFVDRGDNSLLCMTLILLYKLRYPGNVVVLRGNHESRITNTIYGFHEECRQKYPSAINNLYTGRLDSQVWTLFNHLFDAFPLSALIGNRVFCCHGGLSPHLLTLDKVLTFNRFQDIMPQGPMADLTWSDPGNQTGWRSNTRGSGHAFGQDITTQFCIDNGLDYVCRAHQCVKDGYRWEQDNRILTIFSAPNYCWTQNKGAIMKLDAEMNQTFIAYEQVQPCDTSIISNSPPTYFKNTEDDDDDDDDEDGPQPAAAPEEVVAEEEDEEAEAEVEAEADAPPAEEAAQAEDEADGADEQPLDTPPATDAPPTAADDTADADAPPATDSPPTTIDAPPADASPAQQDS